MTDMITEIKQLIIDELELEDISVADIDTDAPLFGEGLAKASAWILSMRLNWDWPCRSGTR
jgi:acyl carrier protein